MAHVAPAPAITPVAPEVNLLTSARALPVEVATFDRWREGLSHRVTSDIKSGVFPGAPAVPSNPSDKAAATTPTVDDHIPFICYTHHVCEEPVSDADVRSEAMAALTAQTPYLVAREFWTGASHTDAQSLMGSAVDTGITGNAQKVLNSVLRAHEDATGGAEGMIHMPVEIAWALHDAQMLTRSGSRLVTPTGHTVIPGPGYPGEGDYGPAAATAGTGTAWVYMTAVVEAAVGEPFIKGSPNPGSGWDRVNRVEVYAERWAIVRFDTTTVQAGLVTL